MNIIDLGLIRRQKEQFVTIPIIEWGYEINGEIQFLISGEKEIPLVWLEQENK
ncbi:TPA: hypothetical protein QCS32_006123 [Bacillus thuringiensis]|nr:hypothetical protein [Bacillus cereus]HDR5354306.1 hypothetical protein [Bacillus thuringiensis]